MCCSTAGQSSCKLFFFLSLRETFSTENSWTPEDRRTFHRQTTKCMVIELPRQVGSSLLNRWGTAVGTCCTRPVPPVVGYYQRESKRMESASARLRGDPTTFVDILRQVQDTRRYPIYL
ncbi:hypothetical protein NPIL_168101 [Nephila pilipes]|uniref:Uncharacterized protein n=1 Tax=Nephila pilipes TaxID=299642 RepID=A0A8X6T5C7_NEPPI|nr:hypothetical protein NPIL_168101 [Nephila pilipes]